MTNDRKIAADLAAGAVKAFTTERGTQHGELEPSFTMIAELWSVYINHAITVATGIQPLPAIHLSAVDVLEMMSLVKKSRNVYGSRIPDHSVDDIGYTALAGGIRLAHQMEPAPSPRAERNTKDAA
jgi:hypothetical protein